MPRAATRSYDSRRRARSRGARTAVKPIVVPVARPATPPAVRIIIATPVIRVEVSGQVFEAPLPSRPVHVGSGDSADLKLACAGVGKDHFVLQPLPDGRHVVKDLASGYPTRVNGIEAHQVSLREGDVIEVGEARIVYRPLPAEAAPPPPPPASPAARPRLGRLRRRPRGPRARGRRTGVRRTGVRRTGARRRPRRPRLAPGAPTASRAR